METIKIDLLDYEVRDIIRCIDIATDKNTKFPKELKKPTKQINETKQEIINLTNKHFPYFSYNV